MHSKDDAYVCDQFLIILQCSSILCHKISVIIQINQYQSALLFFCGRSRYHWTGLRTHWHHDMTVAYFIWQNIWGNSTGAEPQKQQHWKWIAWPCVTSAFGGYSRCQFCIINIWYICNLSKVDSRFTVEDVFGRGVTHTERFLLEKNTIQRRSEKSEGERANRKGAWHPLSAGQWRSGRAQSR